MSRRLPGATESERLTMLTALDDDQCTTRHNPGTLNDVDLGLSKAILQSDPIAVCTSAAATMAKTASLSEESFPDFKLMNGRTVIVYMANGNSASSPTMNIANTGAITMEDASWQAGSFLRLKYVDITVNGTRIQRWLVEAGASNTTSQLNGALTNLPILHIEGIETEIGTFDSKPLYRRFYQSEYKDNSEYALELNAVTITRCSAFLYTDNYVYNLTDKDMKIVFFRQNGIVKEFVTQSDISGITGYTVKFIFEYTKN